MIEARCHITPPFTAAQFTLSAQMMKYWSRFAACHRCAFWARIER